MAETSKIITSPVEEIIKEINFSMGNNIILAGTTGTGKTIVINELLKKKSDDNLVVDGTLKLGEYVLLRDSSIHDLYHTCLIVQKVLLDIEKNYPEKFLNYFINFLVYINSILKQIFYMYMTDIYKRSTNYIDENLYNNPEILIDELLRLLTNYLNYQDITMIIDDFDKVGESSERYQKFIYNRLRNYLNIIMTISDNSVVNDDNKLDNLSSDNLVIKLDYSKDIEMVTEILDKEVHEILMRSRHYNFKYRLRNVLSKETIFLMIKKTNGNLFDMLFAIRMLYSHINELLPSEYNTFILKYIDEEINKSPVISGRIIPKRILYIK